MHLVIAHDTTTNTLNVIGVLTSENDVNNIELSQNQPISGVENKKQFLRLLKNPISITRDQIEIHEKATNYVKRPDIHHKIIGYKDQYTKKESLPYNTLGVTKEDLSKLITIQEQQVKVPKKLSHFEQLKRSENSIEKQKKVEFNRQKQKEDHLKKLKEKEVHTKNEEID